MDASILSGVASPSLVAEMDRTLAVSDVPMLLRVGGIEKQADDGCDGVETCQAWAELREWVEHLVDRFALDTRVIPPCWYRHNTLVEALSALHDLERICIAANASPTGALDWFRGLREIENRITGASARTQGSLNEHRPDPVRAWTPDQAPWQEFVEDDVAGREQRVIDEALAGG